MKHLDAAGEGGEDAQATSSGVIAPGAARTRSVRAAPGESRHGARWSDEERAQLAWEWGIETPRTIAKTHGRLPSAIVRMAERMGLRVGRPQGFEYLSEAADRVGYSRRQLVIILTYAGVRVRRPSSRRSGKHPAHRVVDPADVDKAVALWCQTETITEAARRHGVSRAVLERLVFADPRTPERNDRHRLRVPSTLLDELAAKVNAEHQRPWLKGLSCRR